MHNNVGYSWIRSKHQRVNVYFILGTAGGGGVRTVKRLQLGWVHTNSRQKMCFSVASVRKAFVLVVQEVVRSVLSAGMGTHSLWRTMI